MTRPRSSASRDTTVQSAHPYVCSGVALVGVGVLLATLGPVISLPPAAADPDTCAQGYVWREADAKDHVCVTPDVRSRTAQENQLAASRRDPNGGPYGPDTCLQGYVWREAYPDDHVCVTPDIRTDAANDNAAAASHEAATAPGTAPGQHTVTYTLSGGGSAVDLTLTPGPAIAGNPIPLPFTRTLTLQGVQYPQINWDANEAGHDCILTVDGKVIAPTERDPNVMKQLSGECSWQILG
jgi:hypothetical protein